MLKSNAVPIVLNIGDEEDFRGIVDLVKNRAIVWHDDNFGSTFDVIDIPDDLRDEANNLRGQLIEAVAEYDENLLEKYFEDPESITEDEVHNALRAATQDMSIIPMICGSSFKNKGSIFIRCRLPLSPHHPRIRKLLLERILIVVMRLQESRGDRTFFCFSIQNCNGSLCWSSCIFQSLFWEIGSRVICS